MGCCNSDSKFYMATAPGIAKIVALAIGSAPAVLSIILITHYEKYPRPPSEPNIRVPPERRAIWEVAFLIVLCAALGLTLINLVLYTIFSCLSRNTWTKRFDCCYLTLGGTIQSIVGFIMIGSALTSSEVEPVEMKWAAGFLGIVSGITYWGAATLVNRDD